MYNVLYTYVYAQHVAYGPCIKKYSGIYIYSGSMIGVGGC